MAIKIPINFVIFTIAALLDQLSLLQHGVQAAPLFQNTGNELSALRVMGTNNLRFIILQAREAQND